MIKITKSEYQELVDDMRNHGVFHPSFEILADLYKEVLDFRDKEKPVEDDNFYVRLNVHSIIEFIVIVLLGGAFGALMLCI